VSLWVQVAGDTRNVRPRLTPTNPHHDPRRSSAWAPTAGRPATAPRAAAASASSSRSPPCWIWPPRRGLRCATGRRGWWFSARWAPTPTWWPSWRRWGPAWRSGWVSCCWVWFGEGGAGGWWLFKGRTSRAPNSNQLLFFPYLTAPRRLPGQPARALPGRRGALHQPRHHHAVRAGVRGDQPRGHGPRPGQVGRQDVALAGGWVLAGFGVVCWVGWASASVCIMPSRAEGI
jgi:hypothetical protein